MARLELINKRTKTAKMLAYWCFISWLLVIASCQVSPNNKVRSLSVEINGQVSTNKATSWKWSNRNIGKNENLNKLQFLTPTRGWTASDLNLYETLDSGQTWRQLKVDVPAGGYITSFYFTNALVGWVSIGRLASNVLDPQGDEVWLMNTLNGGRSWNLQFTGKALQISRVVFVNDQEGWVVGGRRIKRETLQTDLFVLHTTDQGRKWTEKSQGLLPAGGFAEYIYSVEPSKAILLSTRGKIFETVNEGRDWQLLAEVPDEPQQTFLSKVGISKSGRLWVLGSADSNEGMWGMYARKEVNEVWTKYRISFYLSDLLLLAENEILAVGYSTAATASISNSDSVKGTILYSHDGGRNWTTVYSDEHQPHINAVAESNNNIWVVGEGGLVLCLESPLSDVISSQ